MTSEPLHSTSPPSRLPVLLVVAVLLTASPCGAALGDVLHVVPAPGFYSSGLAWDGTHLWVSNIADAEQAGHYIVRLTLGDLTASGRVVLIR